MYADLLPLPYPPPHKQVVWPFGHESAGLETVEGALVGVVGHDV